MVKQLKLLNLKNKVGYYKIKLATKKSETKQFSKIKALPLGLGSCWAQIRNRQHDYEKSAQAYIEELLGLHEQMQVECILGIGHPAEKKGSVSVDDLQYDKLRFI